MSQSELKHFFDRYHRRLSTFAYNLLGNVYDAQDVVQDLFADLVSGKMKYTHNDPSHRWCMNHIRFRCRDFIKHKMTVSRHHRLIMESADDLDAYAEARLIKTDLMLKVYEEIENLSAGQRTIFKMKFLQDMTPKEISATLGITIDTVRVQLHKALSNLKLSFANQ